MKLWVKISAICIVVLLIVVSIVCALLVVNARDNIVDLTVANMKDHQKSLCQSFESFSNLYLGEEQDPDVVRAIVLHAFQTFADDTSVLVCNGETLYTYVQADPRQILPVSTVEQRVFLDEVGTRNLVIVGSLVRLRGQSDDYVVYEVQDITAVYRSYRQLQGRFIVIAVLGVLFGTACIILLVRVASRPLKKLSLSAGRIANGEYGERVNIVTHDEVGQLAGDFNRMAEAVQTHIRALEEKNARQELFIGGLTHEFKTPMTSMMLHSEALLTYELPKEQRDASLRHIRTQCMWLERLTQKLLALITLGTDLHKTDASVSELFDRVRESTAEQLGKRGTTLITTCGDERLLMDPDLIQSMLINLVDNASKASEPGQSVELSVSGATISVADHGRGIPADAVDRVFEPFYMVDKSRSKAQGGSGLGLALARRIADAHGMVLKVESVPGEGTVIRAVFPETAQAGEGN